MLEVFTPAGFTALLQVVGIDLALAGDNAIVIGLAAAGLPKEQRARAIFWGSSPRRSCIAFAAVTTQLLEIVGFSLQAASFLWVCWKMWRELQTAHSDELAAQEALSGEDLDADGSIAAGAPRKTFMQAATQIVIADVSMSLDNVLAVAGAAREHTSVLVIGLILVYDRPDGAGGELHRTPLNRYRWIAYVGACHHFLRRAEDDLGRGA